jgi:two-component system LytT family sensor kinase
LETPPAFVNRSGGSLINEDLLSASVLWRIIRSSDSAMPDKVTPASVRPPRLPRALTWSVVFIIYTAIAILLIGYRYLDDLSRQRPGTFSMRVLEEATGVYTVFILLPLILYVVDACLFPRKGWPRVTLSLLAAAVAFSAAHTTLMLISRQIISPLIGLGPYDYGIMLYRYPMEFSNDLVGFAFIVGLYYFFQRFRLAQAQQLAAAELQTKLAQAQLENLRLQLQPHFLFNTLNTISSLMYEDVRAADAMLTQLSELLRLTLAVSRTHEIPLSEELQITGVYLQLMQKRFENRLRVHYAIAPELGDSLVPQLILQPLLENSLRHGMKPGDIGMDISIAAHRDNGSLILTLADTGIGLGALDSAAVFGRGVGLSNIRDRLAQLYGLAQEFHIDNRPEGGAEVTVRVPYRTSARQPPHPLPAP